jgi:toxin-antitoxin system PIN domain toxin
MKSFLVDVNVWVALAYSLHVHHDPAKRWFETIGVDQAYFCRLTQLGFLRLLTNPHVMGPNVMTQPRAWQTYDELDQDLRVSFLAEPEHVDSAMRQLNPGYRSGPLCLDRRLSERLCQGCWPDHSDNGPRIRTYAGRGSSHPRRPVASAFVPASSVFTIASTSNTHPPQVPPLTFCSAAHNRVSSGN